MKKKVIGIGLLLIGLLAMVAGIFLTVRQYQNETKLKEQLDKAVQDFDSVLPGLKKGFVNTDGSEEPLPFMVIDGFKCIGLVQVPETDTAFIVRREDVQSGTPATGNFHIDHSYEEIPVIEEGMQVSFVDINGYVYSYVCETVLMGGHTEPDGNFVIHYEGMATKYTAVCTVN
jgi:hypothetical protein